MSLAVDLDCDGVFLRGFCRFHLISSIASAHIPGLIARDATVGIRCLAVPGGRAQPALAQHLLADLAVLGQRQLGDELDVARNREVRQERTAVIDQLLGGECLPELEHDRGHHVVLTKLGRDRERRGRGHRGVLEHRLLDLPGRDVLAPAADRVLGPVDEPVPPVVVAHDSVAGVEPQVPPRLHGLLGIAQ